MTLEALEDRTLLSAPISTTDGLVAAINAANSAGGATTVTLAPGATIDLTTPNNFERGAANALPVITGNITIVGNGDTIERTGSLSFRLFYVASSGSLTLKNLTLQGGEALGVGLEAEGGAIYSSGMLSLSGVKVQNNTAKGSNGANGGTSAAGRNGADAFGGGLYVAGGIVSLSNDTFSSNFVQGGNGGIGGFGIHSGDGGKGGDAYGGSLYVAGASSVSLNNDTFSFNAVLGGFGGHGGSGGGNNTRLHGQGGGGGAGGNGGNGYGGGLYVSGSSNLTLSIDTLSSNIALGGTGGSGGNAANGFFLNRPGGAGGKGGDGLGGGVYVTASGLTLSNDTLSSNRAQGGDGGKGGSGGDGGKSPGGNQDLFGSTGGTGGDGGAGLGGGLYANASSVTLSNDTLSSNVVQGGFGGNGGSGGNDTTNVAVLGFGGNGGRGGNGGNGTGGGLYVAKGSINLINDTLSGNVVQGGFGGGGGDGGNGTTGILLSGSGGNGGNGGNGGDGLGGGLYVGLSSVTLANTLIAENSVTAGTAGTGGTGGSAGTNGAAGNNGSAGNADGPDVSGEVDSSDHDLIGDTSGSLGFSKALGDILDVGPSLVLLGPLANNGGPTQTMALSFGSRAIDAGDDNAPGRPVTDQRGYARPVGSHVDIGAYEFAATPAITHLALSGNAFSSATPGGLLTYTLTISNNSSTAQSNVALADQLPANTMLVSWTAVPGWSSDAPPAGRSGGTVSAWIDSLAANSSATFTLVVQVTAGTPVHTVINNTASVAPFLDVTNPNNNRVNFNTTVLYAPTLNVVDGGIYNGNPFPATATAVGIDGTSTVAGTFRFIYYAGSSASGTPLSTVPVNADTYTVVATFSSSDSDYMDGSSQTTFTIAQATTDFSNLTMQQIITGTTTITLSGLLTSNTIVPVDQSVSITLNGLTQSALVAADGSFSIGFDTAVLGVGTYSISYSYAGDKNFTAASATGSLAVDYGSQLLFNNNKPVHSGAVLPIKLELTDADGADVSSGNIAVTAISLVDANGNTVSLNAAGSANPDDLFRYDASLGGYIFNLDTNGLAAGRYTLYYTAGDDPTLHSLTFVVA